LTDSHSALESAVGFSRICAGTATFPMSWSSEAIRIRSISLAGSSRSLPIATPIVAMRMDGRPR
jgi:hypothetical protein